MDNCEKTLSSTVFSITVTLLLLVFFCAPISAQALRFQSYVNEQGETVLSNLPAKCVEKGRLTCLQHHPLSAQPKPATTPASQKKRDTRGMASTTQRPNRPARSTEKDLFNRLEQVVEIKRLLDEYYPEPADPETVRSVQEQQDQVLDTLKLIRDVADQQELPSIDRAIDIFKAHRID